MDLGEVTAISAPNPNDSLLLASHFPYVCFMPYVFFIHMCVSIQIFFNNLCVFHAICMSACCSMRSMTLTICKYYSLVIFQIKLTCVEAPGWCYTVRRLARSDLSSMIRPPSSPLSHHIPFQLINHWLINPSTSFPVNASTLTFSMAPSTYKQSDRDIYIHTHIHTVCFWFPSPKLSFITMCVY